MKKLLIASLLLVAATQFSPARGERKVQFRTLCLEQVEKLDKVVIPGAGKKDKPQEVTLYTDVSPVIDGVFGTDEAVFYSEETGADGKVKRIPVGKATLGKSNRQMIIFAPNEDSKGELAYRVMAFDDDEKSFPMGRIRAINLASVAVRYILSDGKPIEIAAGASVQIPYPTEVNEYNLYPVTVEYKDASGKWIKTNTTNWKVSEKKREIAITEYSSKGNILTVRHYGDLPPWRK